ncbi:MAG: hypothetical protein M1833_001898 [Piccolia ochrophora]|nr:MAG: hypothetical protein M1833_001898 [Piccolia ochrophora]
MQLTYSALPVECPSSFDPAIHLHSEQDSIGPNFPVLNSDADELEALHLQNEEVTAEKTRQGIVIQHRAWQVSDIFKSDDDYQLDTPATKRRRLGPQITDNSSSNSSPEMPLISSPVAYPPSSSPTLPTKASDPTATGKPDRPKMVGGFVLDDADGDEEGEDDDRPAPQHTLDKDQPNNDPVSGQSPESRDPSPLVSPPSSKAFSPAQTPRKPKKCLSVRTCSGNAFEIATKQPETKTSFEQLIAARSKSVPGRAKKSYYGVDIHNILDDVARQTKDSHQSPKAAAAPILVPTVEDNSRPTRSPTASKNTLWTEKYRARKFTDLVGDDRTHRQVLRWLKGWDPIVYPNARRPKITRASDDHAEERPHRKILLLTGSPGLGKTTLAHVCARQTGYEVVEINASDDRSREVVKGRIRDSLGTENVRGIAVKTANGKVRKAGRPVCVVVDEVDGAVAGTSASGEGGFIKALVDLLALDQKNSTIAERPTTTGRKRKGDTFRMLRPLVLICNDVYHPSLRPLRQSSLAEIIHVQKPSLNAVVARMKFIFEKEGFPCDGDGVRKLCETTWGISNKREMNSRGTGGGDGDIRGIMVVGEWAASKLRSSIDSLRGTTRLTRQWVEQNVIGTMSQNDNGMRGLGRGGAKEIVERVFLDGAGFPKVVKSTPHAEAPADIRGRVGVAELGKRAAMDRLRDMVDACGESERVVTDCFATYPTQPFQDDVLLSKPNHGYDWLMFYDTLSSKVFSGQEWELSCYLSQPILAFHHLFASPARHSWTAAGNDHRTSADDDAEPLPFTGPRADFEAHEAEKHTKAHLHALQSSLSPPLLRCFRSPESIATDLLPYLMQMLTPDVKPVVVGGSGSQRGVASVRRESEREMVRRAAGVMSGVGVRFERGRLETVDGRDAGWVYRMEPPLDVLATFETASSSSSSSTTTTTTTLPARYAVRQVLAQELEKHMQAQSLARLASTAPPSSSLAPHPLLPAKTTAALALPKVPAAKRDFFGRVIHNGEARLGSCGVGAAGDDGDGEGGGKRRKMKAAREGGVSENKVWVSFHEGFSNAVRKPIGLRELLGGL